MEKSYSSNAIVRSGLALAIWALFLAIELRNVLALRYVLSHKISVPLLWLYPIFTCIPMVGYWKVVSTARKQNANEREIAEKMLFYFSITLLVCFLLILLWGTLLGDSYARIG